MRSTGYMYLPPGTGTVQLYIPYTGIYQYKYTCTGILHQNSCVVGNQLPQHSTPGEHAQRASCWPHHPATGIGKKFRAPPTIQRKHGTNRLQIAEIAPVQIRVIIYPKSPVLCSICYRTVRIAHVWGCRLFTDFYLRAICPWISLGQIARKYSISRHAQTCAIRTVQWGICTGSRWPWTPIARADEPSSKNSYISHFKTS